MNNRTETKLTDLSGMQKGIEGILKQAWERGRKYGQNEGKTQGEWILCEDTYFSKCSICGDIWLNEECGNYCPNCGAKMKGGAE